MAWYFTFVNFLLAAIVAGGIVGLQAWAIATQHRDWPGWQPETATTKVTPAHASAAGLVAEPAAI